MAPRAIPMETHSPTSTNTYTRFPRIGIRPRRLMNWITAYGGMVLFQSAIGMKKALCSSFRAWVLTGPMRIRWEISASTTSMMITMGWSTIGMATVTEMPTVPPTTMMAMAASMRIPTAGTLMVMECRMVGKWQMVSIRPRTAATMAPMAILTATD